MAEAGGRMMLPATADQLADARPTGGRVRSGAPCAGAAILGKDPVPTAAPIRARQSYRHEAFLWRSPADFVSGLVPFVRDGVDAGEPVMVALIPQHAAWVRDELGSMASRAHFVDMVELGHNPARINPAWQTFLDASCGEGRPARGVGEPVWPGRSTEEIRECQLHEALLNLAVDPELPFWLLCPYDATHLDADVLTEAERSHPALVTATSYQGSGGYRGHEHARALFTAELPVPPADASLVELTATTLLDAMEHVTLRLAYSLWSDEALRLSDVIHGLAHGSLERGATRIVVRLWDEPRGLVGQVSDETVVEDFLVGRRHPRSPGEDPFWFANQACDLVQVRSGAHGTTVRLHLGR